MSTGELVFVGWVVVIAVGAIADYRRSKHPVHRLYAPAGRRNHKIATALAFLIAVGAIVNLALVVCG